VKTASTAQALAVKRAIEHRFGVFTVTTTTAAEALKNAQAAPKGFDTFFRLMGVIAIIIGGIGIINNMLVAARRRTKEVAVLKAVGMKGRQVVLALTLEALILALAGTTIGIVLGIGASVEVTRATGSITGASIAWSLSPGAIISGAVVGIVATVLFAYLPIVKASRSRPVAALRSDNAKLAGLGRWRSTLLVLALAGIAGYLTILYTGLFSGAQAVAIGVVAGVGALAIAGLLTQVFVLAVWLISKLPAMGRLSLRMAFRNMGTQKRRLGSTLLALFIGMMALSFVSIISQSLKVSAQSYVQKFNTNVFVQTKQNAASVRNLNRELSRLPGIRHRETGAVDQAVHLASVNGVDVTTLLQRDLAGHTFTQGDLTDAADQAAQGIEGHDPRIFSNYFTISRGRNLGIQDIGTNHVVIGAKLARPLGIVPGSHIVLSEGRRYIPFVVVGIISDKTAFVTNGVFADLRAMQRDGLTAPNPNHFTFTSLEIDGKHLKSDIATLQRRLPTAAVVDVSDFTTQITSFVDSLALLPEIIAVLCLIAGAVIIANTVALGMIERRNEFGVMKAVGAKRRTILQFLAVEHAIIGFVGAAAGVGLAILGASFADASLLYLQTSLNPVTLGGLILLGIGLALGASALTALPASGEKPLTVLRYE
jgi:putative ABC transport system permease protein